MLDTRPVQEALSRARAQGATEEVAALERHLAATQRSRLVTAGIIIVEG